MSTFLITFLLMQSSAIALSDYNPDKHGPILDSKTLDEIMVERIGTNNFLEAKLNGISGRYVFAINKAVEDMQKQDVCGNNPIQDHIFGYVEDGQFIKIMSNPRARPQLPTVSSDGQMSQGIYVTENALPYEGCIATFVIDKFTYEIVFREYPE